MQSLLSQSQARARHLRAIALMVFVTTLWSTAGVVTRHLESASGLEVTFWRSAFATVFVGSYLAFVRRDLFGALHRSGRAGFLSGLMWSVMFSCFMLALMRTTVANTLVVLSVQPLLTAFLTWIFLRQPVAPRTWVAIAVASAGILEMFAGAFEADGGRHVIGMLIAFAVPVAASINFITLKKIGHDADLVPAVFIGGLISAGLMALAMAWSGGLVLRASAHDVTLLALLGFFQLGLPCMLMVVASRRLSAPELSLLALLEVLQGPIWAWWFAGEVPQRATLIGGAVVLVALVGNELLGLRED